MPGPSRAGPPRLPSANARFEFLVLSSTAEWEDTLDIRVFYFFHFSPDSRFSCHGIKLGTPTSYQSLIVIKVDITRPATSLNVSIPSVFVRKDSLIDSDIRITPTGLCRNHDTILLDAICLSCWVPRAHRSKNVQPFIHIPHSYLCLVSRSS